MPTKFATDRLLPGLVRLGGRPRTLGFDLFLGGFALGIGLVLLGLTFALQVVASGDHPGDIFGLALHTFDDTLDCFFPTRLVITHEDAPFCDFLPRDRRRSNPIT
jgi:hypothetical protein